MRGHVRHWSNPDDQVRTWRQLYTQLDVDVSEQLCADVCVITSATNNPEALSEMEWSLQPGETVRALAQLIYPKKPHIQKYFIAETIKLNQEVQPDLRPSTVFSQPNVILIPSIKQLSFKYAVSPRR